MNLFQGDDSPLNWVRSDYMIFLSLYFRNIQIFHFIDYLFNNFNVYVNISVFASKNKEKLRLDMFISLFISIKLNSCSIND